MTAYSIVTVTLEDRADGGLRVFSEDLPGLILSGPDKPDVCERIAPAIQALLEYQGIMVASVSASRPIMEVMKQPSPRELAMNVQHEEMFVVVLKNTGTDTSRYAVR